MQRNAMAQPVGWRNSAVAYARLFRDLASRTASDAGATPA
jgi:glycogen synthase